MKLHFLGTGTSTGVPQIGCKCKVCTSTDCRDSRLRASAILSHNGTNLLIDCGPDFRTQMLDNNSPHLDALLITHIHFDHIGGIEDLRPYCKESDFYVYCQADVANGLRDRIAYCFDENPYPGVPSFQLIDIKANKPININGIDIEPLSIMHYKLPILGFKAGNLVYITDAKVVPDETIEKIKGIDTLVINSLRIEEHISHMSLEQTLQVIERVKPRIAYLTHLSHDMGLHAEVERLLPDNVKIAYDNLTLSID